MKAFEEWYKTYKYNGDFATSYCQHTWKAALEWWLGEGTGGNIRFKNVDCRIKLIKEELEGK